MKTKITTITLAVILCVLSLKAQERYLPILDEVVRFNYSFKVDAADWKDLEYGTFEFRKDIENENVYHVLENEDFFWYSHRSVKMEVSDDNSKLWWMCSNETHANLIMDLNLDVGDEFKGFTVARVYQKDGRKHIEFEGRNLGLKFGVCKDEKPVRMNEDYYVSVLTFIEGIGPNFFRCHQDIYVWLYARYKSGELEYGIDDGYAPRWFWCNCMPSPHGGQWCDYCATCEKKTHIKEPKINTLTLTPNPSGDKVQLRLPETITGKAVLTISDLSGRIIETVAISKNALVLDISRYAPATYLVKLSAANCQYVGKIIKK